MLSKHMTNSLMILITIFAFAFVVPSAMAAFDITLNADAEDVSFADGIQVPYGTATTIKVTSAEIVNLGDQAATASTAALERVDFSIVSYNAFGGTAFASGTTTAALASTGVVPDVRDGKNFMIDVDSIAAPAAGAAADARIVRVVITLKADMVEKVDDSANKNTKQSITLHYVAAEDTDADGTGTGAVLEVGQPGVVKIERAGNEFRPVTGTNFDVLITLTEEPRKDGFKKDHINVSNANVGDPVFLDNPTPPETPSATELGPSGRDGKLYRYVVTITPKYENRNDIVVKVKSFYDQEKMSADMQMYEPPIREVDYMEGKDKLTVKVGQEILKDKSAGVIVDLPNETRIPASGWTVFAKDNASSGIIDNPENDKDEPKASARRPEQVVYNLVQLGGLPNLETFFANGGTVDLVGADLYISEIMWGSDASLPNSYESQWIEIANKGTSSVLTGDKTHKLIFYAPNVVLPDVSTVADRVGTVGTGGYWSIAGKGQSGRSHIEEGDPSAILGHIPIISMQRVMGADGMPADGTLASSWVQSAPPSTNFRADIEGVHIATPGAAPITFPAPPAPAPTPVVTPPTPVAMATDIMITEIMVDTGNGRLPQWIELNNVSGKEVSLKGWSLSITNDAADADVVGSNLMIDLSSAMLGVSKSGSNMGKGKSLLVVSSAGGRSSASLANVAMIDASAQLKRGNILSTMGFRVSLIPPQTSGIVTPGDMAGNLGADPAWDLPMGEDSRSSLIRKKMGEGTEMAGWVLASDTSLTAGPVTYYGSDEDAGTPGYDAGGPLPVELSHFRPARDKATGQVVITWSTQSELNNAGFFIKRSQQRTGQFQVINATMIPGAGTTSEKQTLPIQIQLLNLTSYTTTKLKTSPSMGIVRR